MQSPPVRIQDSIAIKLLKVVFSIYFIVTLSVTLIHMAAEYYNTKDSIKEDLIVFEKTFEHALATEVWNLDDAALESIVRGIIEVPVIVGVQIRDTDNESLIARGMISDENRNVFSVDKTGSLIPENSVLEDLIEYKFKLTFVTEDGESIQVGNGQLYSSTGVVFKKVQHGFAFILINAFIKTAALWIIFLWGARILLIRPLNTLTAATDQLDLDTLEHLKVDVHTSGRNELKVLEEAFNSMVKKLLMAKERTTSLRVFFTKIADFQDPTRMLRSAFQEFHLHISLTNAVLLSPHKVGEFFLNPSYGRAGGFLDKYPSSDFLKQIFTSRDQEIVVLNTVDSDSSLHQFYDQSEDIPPQSHFIYIRVPGLSDHIICLFRSSEHPMFDSADVEYIKSMLNEIRIAQENINAIREHTRMESELQTAAAVHRALFPRNLPQFSNLELASFFQSASETGGDWYGFSTKIKDSLFILIGDVTGHGTPAALVAATAQATCKTLEGLYQRTGKVPLPSEFLQHLNEAVYSAGAPDFLMTFFVGRVDLNTGEMLFSNAAHNFPILVSLDGQVQHALNRNCRLGNKQEWTFEDSSLQLQEGDLLFFYTDGLTENVNHENEAWGERKLVRYLKKHRHLSAQMLMDSLVGEVKKFYNGHPPEDDVTIVACKITAPFGQKTDAF